MTLVAETSAASAVTALPATGVRAEARTAIDGRRLAAAALMAAVGIVAAAVLFDGPVARLWYDTRQHHLAADLDVHRAGVRVGDAVGVLQIPKLGVNVVLVEGAATDQLRAGPGHARGTPLPGAAGNSVVFGHRSRWGGPFGPLGKLAKDDVFALQLRTGRTYVFKVLDVHRAAAGDDRLLAPSDDHRLTLVAGTGGRRSTDRLVVTAVSGDVGHLSTTPAHPAPVPTRPLANSGAAWLALVVLMGGAGLALSWRWRPGARALVLVPLAATAVLLVLLQADVLVAPLR